MKVTAMVLSALGWLGSLSPGVAQASVPDLTSVLLNPDTVSRLRQLAPYVKSLRPEEVPAALKQAIASHGPGRDAAIDALSGRWVELDAPAALAFARQTTDREAKASIENTYYGAWAERDPDGVLKAASLMDGGERANAIWPLAHKIGLRDPQRANDLLKSVHSSRLEDTDYFIFWNWAETNPGQATQTLLEEAKTASFSYPCEEAVEAMTDRLFDNDPKAAASWVARLPAKLREEAFKRLESEWAQMDRDEVATWLKSQPDSDQVRNAVLNLPKKNENPPRFPVDPAFSSKAAELDKILWESNDWLEFKALLPFVDGLSAAEFPQAFAHLRNTPDSNRDLVTDVLVERWYRVDPAGAINAIPLASTIHDREFSEHFLTDVYAAWSQREPKAAFANATRDYHGVGDCDVLRVIFAALARQDPARAYATLRKLNDANSHLLVIPIFTEWAVRDLPAATKALAHEPHVEGAIEGIVIGLMRHSPDAAIAWAGHLPAKANHDRAQQAIATRWPDDPAAAEAWLEKTHAFDGKDSVLGDVALDWAIRNTPEALHYATTLPDGKEKDQLLYYGLAQLTYDNADAACRFARGLPGKEMKEHALATVLSFWSEYDPTAAADFLASITVDATPSDVAGIAYSLSDHDPAAAIHWLDALPASIDKAPAIGNIAKNWHRTDAPAAESWVNQQPAGPLYDAGAQGICTALNGDLPPALKWARSIGDPKMRRDAVYDALGTAIYHRVKFGMLEDSQGLKDTIRSAPELTDKDKNVLIARLPVLQVIQGPKPLQTPPPPASH